MKSCLFASTGLITVAACIYLYGAFTCFFSKVTFLTAFKAEFKRTNSRETAYRAAVNVFLGRSPFNALDSNDVAKLVNTFAVIPDARFVAELWRSIDRLRDASPVKIRVSWMGWNSGI